MISQTTVSCFLSLAETLSFTGTASALYLTQQAVSKSIANLEEDLGVSLFFRSRQGVVITEAGERYYEFFSRWREELREIKAELCETYAMNCSPLHIGYQSWIDFGPAPSNAQAAIAKEYPGFSMFAERLSPGELVEQLLAHKLDAIIVLRRFVPDLPGLKVEGLSTAREYLMVAKRNPKNSPDASYKDFIREPFILDSFENGKAENARERARSVAAKAGLKPCKVIVMNNRETAYTAAELGLGVIIVTELSRIRQSSLLQQYLLNSQEPVVAAWMGKSPNYFVQKYVSLFRKELQSYMKGKLKQEMED